MSSSDTIQDKKILSFNDEWQEAESLIKIEKELLSSNQYIKNRIIKLGTKFGRGHRQAQQKQQLVFEYTSLKSQSYRRKLKQQRGPLCECCRNNPNNVFFHINQNLRDGRPVNILLLCRQCNTDLRLQRICIFPRRGIQPV